MFIFRLLSFMRHGKTTIHGSESLKHPSWVGPRVSARRFVLDDPAFESSSNAPLYWDYVASEADTIPFKLNSFAKVYTHVFQELDLVIKVCFVFLPWLSLKY